MIDVPPYELRSSVDAKIYDTKIDASMTGVSTVKMRQECK